MKKDIIKVIKNQNQNVETKNSGVTEEALDSYMQTQLGLGIAGMTPVYGIGADLAALLHSMKHGKAGDSLLNLGAMVPGLGMFAGVKKVDDLMYLMKNTGMSEKEALEVLKKYQKSGGNTPVVPDKRVIDADPAEIKRMQDWYKDPGLRKQQKMAEEIIEEDLDLMKTLKNEKGFNSKDIIDIIKKPRE